LITNKNTKKKCRHFSDKEGEWESGYGNNKMVFWPIIRKGL